MFKINDKVIFITSNDVQAVGIVSHLKDQFPDEQYSVSYFDELGRQKYKYIFFEEIIGKVIDLLLFYIYWVEIK